jgi:hypothetical protein
VQNTRIPPREVLWNLNFGSPVRVTGVFGGLKTTNGKVYKDATVSRVEGDGIVLKTETGISKVYFTELPQEVQERFHWVKPDAPREPFYGRWAAAAEDPAVLAKIIAAGTVVIAGVGLVIGHIRSWRQPTTRARRHRGGKRFIVRVRISSKSQLCDSRIADMSRNAVGVWAGFSAVLPAPRGRDFLFFPS